MVQGIHLRLQSYFGIFHGLHIQIEHINDVKMFKTQVEPRAATEWFYCKDSRPWKIVAYLFFYNNLTVFYVHFLLSLLGREKQIVPSWLHFQLGLYFSL